MAGLQKQVIPLPFVGGLDQKTDPWLVEPGKQTSVVNGVFTKQGQIRKRNGMSTLSRSVVGGGTIESGTNAFFHKNQQLVSDGDSLYSYSPAISSYIEGDLLPRPIAKRSTVISSGFGFAAPDVAVSGNIEIYAWMDPNLGSVYAIVVDSDGNILSDMTELSSPGVFPRLTVLGNYAIAVYMDSATTISARRIDLTNVSAGWEPQVTLASDADSTAALSPVGLTSYFSRFVIAYNSSVPTVRLRSFNDSFSNLATEDATPTSVAGLNPCLVSTSRSDLFVGYSQSAVTRLVVCDPFTLLPSGSPFTINTASSAALGLGLCRVDSGTVCAVIQTNSPALVIMQKADASGPVGVSRRISGAIAVSRPFVFGDRAYAAVYQAASPPYKNGTTLIMDLKHNDATAASVTPGDGTFRPVCTIAPRQSYATIPVGFDAPQTSVVPVPGTDRFLLCGQVALSGEQLPLLGLSRLSLDFSNTSRFQPAELGQNLHLSGGVPVAYDGRIAQEAVFLDSPNVNSLVATVTSGGALGSGSDTVIYQYQFVFIYRDAAGQIHRSAPSDVVPVQIAPSPGPTAKVTFTLIPHLSATTRQDDEDNYGPPIGLDVYRSQWVQATQTMSSILYRLTTDQLLQSQINVATDAGTFTFVDKGESGVDPGGVPFNFTDASIGSNAPIYTSGGTLSNVCPPSASLAHVHNNRVWLAGTDDGSVWYSKQFVQGEGVAFCDEFTLTLADPGPITAIGTLDEKLILFKRSSIYVISGDGPSDNGAGNDLTSPQRVSSDVGCIEPRSLVLTPDGLMFQSAEGIMLLSRSLEVTYLGTPVEDTLQANPTITSAAILGDQSEVRFTCQSAADPSLGVTIVYNYLFKNWSTFSLQGGAALAGSCVSPTGQYVGISFDGTTFLEKISGADRYLDGTSSWIPTTIESAWIKTAGILGFQRVRRVGLLGNSMSNTDLTISLAPDYGDYLQSHTWTSGDPSFGPPERMTVHVGSETGMHQKCESMRVKITDAPPTTGSVGTGQGVTFTGIALEIGAKPSMVRLPEAARE